MGQLRKTGRRRYNGPSEEKVDGVKPQGRGARPINVYGHTQLMKPFIRISAIRCVLLAILSCAGTGNAQNNPATPPVDNAERVKQETIYHARGELRLEGYVIDRSLAAYGSALQAGFPQSLANLGPNDRWLDVGAGQGLAILDYQAQEYDPRQAGRPERNIKKASAVAMSIEDRRTPRWHKTAESLEAGKIQYVFGKSLRQYSAAELGTFQLITDVIGGFSYTENLQLFMEKVLSLLTINGYFYTLAQDVRAEDGYNKPYYTGEPFLTQIKNAAGTDIGICAWLKSISCVEVSCTYKGDWTPPIETYKIRKTCSSVSVPPLNPERYVAGTPPERVFTLATPAPAAKP